jgi:hypothetical protein
MPHLTIKLDVDRRGFDTLGGMPTAAGGIADGRVVHLGNDAEIEVGTLRHGMASGKDSVALCFKLPDGKIVLAETSAELFLATARAISGWQEGRRDRGED